MRVSDCVQMLSTTIVAGTYCPVRVIYRVVMAESGAPGRSLWISVIMEFGLVRPRHQ